MSQRSSSDFGVWRNLIAPMVVIGALLVAPAFAQEIGNATRGWKLAFGTCAVCHGVRNGGKSRSRLAPTFSAIANVKGMSAMALNVALLSSHRSMPNIVLDAQERADIISFILTLKTN
jgi:mono/diheme cytochrome c family protein